MISVGTAFLFVLFYLICVVASRVSKQPFYKRMWKVTAFVLGVAILATAGIYIAEILGTLLAL